MRRVHLAKAGQGKKQIGKFSFMKNIPICFLNWMD